MWVLGSIQTYDCHSFNVVPLSGKLMLKMREMQPRKLGCHVVLMWHLLVLYSVNQYFISYINFLIFNSLFNYFHIFYAATVMPALLPRLLILFTFSSSHTIFCWPYGSAINIWLPFCASYRSLSGQRPPIFSFGISYLKGRIWSNRSYPDK